MATLNLSLHGPAIKSSYNGVVNSQPSKSDSSTYARWALFSVQAPLANAFQDSGSKESVLKVQSTGDGELAELIEDFSEGRVQFAFAKVKDPNTGLPKHILFAWCGEGVPERTKGYFTSYLNAVSKILHGYHVQITARSESDLEPTIVMKKVSDASGAKYSAADSERSAPGAPPPIKSKPVFTPTAFSAGGRSVDPLVAARSRRDEQVDADGWGADAPPVTRTQIEKVESAYQPHKVDFGNSSRQPEPSRFTPAPRNDTTAGDVVGGSYQPVGKVDIAAIRAQAKNKQDERPTIVKGAYEPIGKVDIAAIRAQAQRPSEAAREEEAAPEQPKPVSDRAAAFSQPAHSERLTSLPKPKIGNKFGGASSFTGTKPPAPGNSGGLLGPSGTPSAPVTTTSRTFANEGGKTPAQLWAEKKAKQQGSDAGASSGEALSSTSPIPAQKSGEWKSGYSGKSWASVQTPAFGRGPVENVRENDMTEEERLQAEAEEPEASGGGVSALRDRFKNTTPISASSAPPVPRAGAPSHNAEEEEEAEEEHAAPPPPVPSGNRPTGGFALPGLPSRPAPVDDVEEEEQEEEEERAESPIRVAQPVSRSHVPAPAVQRAPEPEPEPEPEEEEEPEPVPVPVRSLPPPAAEETHQQASSGAGQSAVIIYDYAKDEDNEIDLVEGQMVSNIEQVDPDWWTGTNVHGESGLFPSAYVSLVEDEPEQPAAAHESTHAAPTPAAPPAPAQGGGGGGITATALFDYEAAEDNELSFSEGMTVTDLEFPDDDWWFGHCGGRMGLFPSNYVERDA